MPCKRYVGAYDWTDRQKIRRDLRRLREGSIVVEGAPAGRTASPGGGPGARPVCRDGSALCDFYDRSAGYRRNEAMLRLAPGIVYAYPLAESRGTAQMIQLAEDAGIPVLTRTSAPIG